MKQVNLTQNYQNTEQSFVYPLQILNLFKKVRTIDSDKRITNVSEKGQPNKVIIGRRNAISRISARMQKQLQNFQFSKFTPQEAASQSLIVSDFSQIQKFFQQKFQRTLLYRATQNNFSIQKFHQLCDGYLNTLVICRTQSSNVIGGFTPLSWDCNFENNKTYFKSDNKNLTFLFSLTQKQKYPIKKSQRNKAICCYQKYGPTFGGGYDLCIGDNAGLQSSTFSYFPRNFQCPSSKHSLQQKNKIFTGSKKNNLKLKQWQVFHLKFKQNQRKQQFKGLNMEELQNHQNMIKKMKQKQKWDLKYLKKFLGNMFVSVDS